ncbi:transmembrane protein [Arabidopsis thaliana]|uniref:Transmembrane protein n=1 Tax=Arabidopsis thaliana TaxID=3702 RepID=A8MSE4_ARATH|nr:uncharacterized protein AT3G47836 [Arabidopsis thaliana]AEE78338.1 transmembrane protein [Arabidopsis thaliana]|eukprot:NP_001078255.1 transmembrane protein [Arabidopsis thaliana]
MSIVVSLGTTLNLWRLRNLKNNPNDPNSVAIYPSSSRCFLESLCVLFLSYNCYIFVSILGAIK